MTIETKNAAWGIAVVSFAAAACGSTPSTPTIGWSCGNADVPYGLAYQCMSTDARVMVAAASLTGTYTCPPGGPTTAACPPPAEDAPLPTPSEAGATPPLTSGDASPPAKDGPPPTDAGESDDSATPDDASCKGACGGGHGGNPHGNPPGQGGGTPGPDASPAPPGSGGTPPVQPPPGEGSLDAGTGGDGGAPPFTLTRTRARPRARSRRRARRARTRSACGACVPDDTTDDCVPPSSGGCWVTGGGVIQPPSGQDSFGGNAMPMKSGTIRGEWENVDHSSGQQMHGEPTYLYCRHVDEPGPGVPNGPDHDFTTNQAYFGGPARLNVNGAWADGYWFDVVVDDHGEGKGANAGRPGPLSHHDPQPGRPEPVRPRGLRRRGQHERWEHPAPSAEQRAPVPGATLPSWVVLQP